MKMVRESETLQNQYKEENNSNRLSQNYMDILCFISHLSFYSR